MFRHTFRALSHRAFRRYFIGQGVSQTGNWIQQVVLSWLAYENSGSALWLGLVVAAGQAPLLLAPLGGLLADRHDRRRLLLISHGLGLLVACWLIVLSLTGSPGLPALLLASLALGGINALEMPVRHAFIANLVGGTELLSNAVALNSLVFNGARLIGPPLAGVLFAAFGAPLCFAINALSYVAALHSLLRIRGGRRIAPDGKACLRQSFDWLRTTRPARWLLFTATLTSISLTPVMTLLPVYAHDIFDVGPTGLGQLLGASGIGALAATMWLAARRTPLRLEVSMTGGALLFGLSCIGFAGNQIFWLACLLLAVGGASLVAVTTSSTTLLQWLVPDGLRGRIMALHGMFYLGSMPLGSLLAGAIAERWSVPMAFMTGGATMLALTALLAVQLPRLAREIEQTRRKAMAAA